MRPRAARYAAPFVAGILLLAGCTTGSSEPVGPSTPAPVSSADSGEVAQEATPIDAIEPWRAGAVPGGDASGPAFPEVWPESVVEGSGSATSLWPTLRVPGVKGEVDVEVVDLSAGGGFGADGTGPATQVVWSGRADARSIVLPSSPPVLTQGGSYAYRVDDGSGWQGPWTFAADRVRSGVAPTDSFAGLEVNLLSGVVATSWRSKGFARPAGALQIGMQYAVDGPAAPGLATGWAWSLPGSGLIKLEESEAQGGSGDDAGPLSVRLVTASGGGPTFVRTETGAYVPGLADGTSTSYSASGTLIPQGEGRWTFTAPDGTLTEFAGGRVAREWLGGVPVAAFEWDPDGRLQRVSDGIDGGQAIGISYADGCQASGWDGFQAPDGLACALQYPDGSASQFGYVEAAGAPRLAIAVDAGGVGVGWGWDAAGRLAAGRGVSETAMAALSTDWRVPEFITQVAYDAQGRVESITDAAAAPGQPRVRRSYAYPAGSDLTARVLQAVVDGAEITPVASSLGDGAVTEVRADASTWKVLERRGIDGLASTVRYDKDSGVVSGGVASDGRTMSIESEGAGILSSSVGPYLGDRSGAMRTERTLDSTITDPELGAKSQAKPWTGLAAMVWAGDQAAVPSWWDADVLGQGLQADFTAAPVANGASGPWRAQLTGLWRVSDAGTYAVELSSSDRVTVGLTVDGVRCSPEAGERGCELRLAKGEHSLLVTLDVSDPQGAGSFRITAGAGDRPKPISLDDLRPNYNMATRVSINDDVAGQQLGTDVLVTSRPWAGQPDRVVSAGGLTTSYSYEATDASAEAFGRQTATTTPGGSVMSAEYYGPGETAINPCNDASITQAGLLKSVTRYDGVVIASVYDQAGRPVAVTTKGDGLSETSCTEYDAAGRVIASKTLDASGAVIEEARASSVLADGRNTVTTVVTLGPASPTGSGESFTSSRTTDLAGRTVEVTDASGTRATFSYSPDGALLRRDLWAPQADRSGPATLVIEFGYDDATGRPITLTANGTTMATSTYDNTGRLTSVSYLDGVTTDLAYDPVGTVESLQVRADGSVYTSSRQRNPVGRSVASALSVKRNGQEITDQRWDYEYDEAGRLARATLATSGDAADTGGKKRVFGYDYGAAPDGCFAGAGANLDRVGGSRDGDEFATCRDQRGRLRWTTDPHLTGGSGKATAEYDGLGRLTSLGAVVPLELTWSSGTRVAVMAEGSVRTELVTAGGALQRMTRTEDDSITVTRFGYAGSGTPAFILDEAGAVLDTRLGLPGGVIASLGPQPLKGSTRLLLPDAFGAAMVSTVDGRPVGATDSGVAPRFGPFGEPLTEATVPASVDTGIGPGTDYGFQAGAANPTFVGHHDLTVSARPYHPWLGEFLASDPSPGASSTAYGYGKAAPVDNPDFSGGWSVWDTVSVAGSVLALLGGISGGQVSEGTSKLVQVATGVAMAGGMAAAVVGTSISWAENGTNATTIGVTAGAVVGILAAGIGLNNWANVVDARMARASAVDDIASVADSQLDFFVDGYQDLSIGGDRLPPVIEFGRATTGVKGVEVTLTSLEGIGTRLVYVGDSVYETIDYVLAESYANEAISTFVNKGVQAGYVRAESADQLVATLTANWRGP